MRISLIFTSLNNQSKKECIQVQVSLLIIALIHSRCHLKELYKKSHFKSATQWDVYLLFKTSNGSINHRQIILAFRTAASGIWLEGRQGNPGVTGGV